MRKATRTGASSQVPVRLPAVRRPRACVESPCARTGRSTVRPRKMASGPPWEGLRPYAKDARIVEVRQTRSTCEAAEQGRGTDGGGGGGKESGRGKRGPAKSAPDAEPDQLRAQCVGPCTRSCPQGRACEVHRVAYGFRRGRSQHNALDALAAGPDAQGELGCSMRTSVDSSTPSITDGCCVSSSTGSRTRPPKAASPTPLAGRSLPRQPPKAGAQCASSARWDLCGGRRVTGVPTAITPARLTVPGVRFILTS